MIHLDEKDLARIRGFLVHDTGRRFLAYLRQPDQRPKIRMNAQPHEVQMDAGAQNGYDMALTRIEEFAKARVVEMPESEMSPVMRDTRQPRITIPKQDNATT